MIVLNKNKRELILIVKIVYSYRQQASTAGNNYYKYISRVKSSYISIASAYKFDCKYPPWSNYGM